MQALRRTGLAIVLGFLPLALFGFGFSWAAHAVFGGPEPLKQALRQSGVYRDIIPNTLAQNSDSATNTAKDTTHIPTSRPEVQHIIINAFPPAYLQAQTEAAINNWYAWVQGKTPTLHFAIDLSGPKTQLADGLAKYATDRLNSLPKCPITAIPSGDIDPLNATCVPPNFDIASAASKVRSDVQDGFLKNSRIDQNSMNTKNGQTPRQQQIRPQTYRRAVAAMYALGTLVIALSAAAVLLGSTWRKGARHVAVEYISVGGVTTLFAVLLAFALHKAEIGVANSRVAAKALQVDIIRIIETLARDLRTYWLLWGIGLMAIGIVAIIILHVTKPKAEESAPVEAAPAEPPKAETSAEDPKQSTSA